LLLIANKLFRFSGISVCISAAPAALDRYLAAVPAHVAHPIHSIQHFRVSVFF